MACRVWKLLFLTALYHLEQCAVVEASKSNNPDARDLKVLNQSGSKVNIYWINRWRNDELVLNNSEGPVLFGAEHLLNTFVTHEFELEEVPRKSTGLCGGENGKCRRAQFQVNANDDQLVRVLPTFELELEDNKSRARDEAKDILVTCRQALQQRADEMADDPIDALSRCMEEQLHAKMEKADAEIGYHASLRKTIGSQLATYACGDGTSKLDQALEPTEAINSLNWSGTDARGRRFRHLTHIYHEREESSVQVLRNFVQKDYCQHVQSSLLQGDSLPWSVLNRDSKTADLIDKLYNFLSEALHWDRDELLKHNQQLNPNLFVWSDSQDDSCSASDNEDDAKTCSSSTGSTVSLQADGVHVLAQVILFCEVPEKGGAMHIPKAGVQIESVGRKNDALVVTNPKVDHSFTDEIVECPVLKGTKQTLAHAIYVPL